MTELTYLVLVKTKNPIEVINKCRKINPKVIGEVISKSEQARRFLAGEEPFVLLDKPNSPFYNIRCTTMPIPLRRSIRNIVAITGTVHIDHTKEFYSLLAEIFDEDQILQVIQL